MEGTIPWQSWAESCFPGLEASSKPAQHLDARVEMCERVVRVMTSIAEHMNKMNGRKTSVFDERSDTMKGICHLCLWRLVNL